VVDKLNELLLNIYPYNYHVEESPLGDPWVRVRSYSCIDHGQPDHIQDFDGKELLKAFEVNQGIQNPEGFLGNLGQLVRTAGPPELNYKDGRQVPEEYYKNNFW